MKVQNWRVYDLEESIVASGFPMISYFHEPCFCDSVSDLQKGIHTADLDRAFRLASAPDGSGHRNYLSGILVSFNVTATNVWWMQFERYHFAQIVSSMSKMHRLKKIVESKFSKPRDPNDPINLDTWLFLYELMQDVEAKKKPEEALIYECPMGLELTARVTTNYLQLRTIYVQRRSHKLQEWRDFCAWIASLPYARELITLERGDADHEK